MSKSLTNRQVQDIFIKICEENQWRVSVWKSRSKNSTDTDYRLIEKDEVLERRDDTFEISIEEFARKINFYENNYKEVSVNAVPATKDTEYVNLRNSHGVNFYILSEILHNSNYNTLNKIKFFSSYRDNEINWKNLLEMINTPDVNTPNALKTMLNHYVGKLNNDNLKTIFSKIHQLPKKDMYDVINNFCVNHLDQLEDITYKNFIINQVKDLIPNHTDYFKSFLHVNQLESNLFSDEQKHYKTFHLSKQILFNNFPLPLDKPVEVEDYHVILDNSVTFLNKPTNLKKLGATHIDFMGKQKKHDSFILTVQTTDKFDVKVLEDFILKVLEECLNQQPKESQVNGTIRSDRPHIYQVREAVKKSYNNILNFALLDSKIPHKEDSSPLRRKI